jgi:hypothetical protein
MPTTQAPPRLPGVRATTLFLINALVLSLFLLLFLLLLVPLIGLMTVEATQAGGHLPWPVAHWALTTPAGLVGILAICVGVGAPAFIVGQRHFLRGWTLARAVDVTAVPPWVWLTRPPVYPGETRADRWLGRSQRAQLVSLTLLGGAVLICLLLVESFLAAVVVTLGSIPHPPCGVGGCPPIYPLIPLGLVSEWVIMGLAPFAQYRWLRRVEGSSGVWLRNRNWFQTQGLCYIRQPGVTPEAAAVALGRFAPAEAVPLARAFAFVVLGGLPLMLVVFAGGFLQFWLQTQWLPG